MVSVIVYAAGAALVLLGVSGIWRGSLVVPRPWTVAPEHRDAEVKFVSYLLIAFGCGLLFVAGLLR